MPDDNTDREAAGFAEHDGIDAPELLLEIVRKSRATAMAVVRDFVVIDANDAYARVFGATSAKALRNTDLSGVLSPESLEAARQRLEIYNRGATIRDPQIYDGTTLDGRPLKFEVTGIPWPLDHSFAMQVVEDITERELNIEKLRHSEKLYKTVAETIPVAVILRDSSNKVIYVNDQAESITGFSKEEIAANAILNALTDEDRRSVLQDWSAQSPVEPREFSAKLKDGSTLWTIGASRMILDENGAYAGMCNAFVDITGRKQAERDLLTYKKTVEQAADGIVFADLDDRVVFANKAWAQMHGRSPAECIGKSLKLFHTPEQWRKEIRLLDRELMREGTSVREVGHVRADGSVFPARMSSALLSDDEGNVLGAITVARDITDRKNTENALAIYRQALEQAADGIAVVDLGGNVLLANAAWARMHGWSVEELIGQNLSVFHTPEQYANEVVPFNEKLIAEGSNEGEVNHIRKDGTRFPTSMSCAVLKSDDGTTLGLVGVARDISEMKEAEFALTQVHDDLARAYDLQRQFLNSVSHEVRTPLSAIMGYANMLIEEIAGPLNDEQKSMLRKSLTSSQMLLGIVDDVLETARSRSGATTLRPSACSPARIVGNAVAAVQPQASQKGIDVQIECRQRGVTGIYDAEKLRAIVTNLVANAVKFTQSGCVTVTTTSSNRGTEVIVADTGIGIPADRLATAFGEFQQLDQPKKHKPSGFGLGLAIVARMVWAIGATLIVSSEKGVGTAVTLYAPVVDEIQR